MSDITLDKLVLFQEVEWALIESMADLLDSEGVIFQEAMAGLRDPEPRETSELHIRMAHAALEEYRKTMIGK